MQMYLKLSVEIFHLLAPQHHSHSPIVLVIVVLMAIVIKTALPLHCDVASWWWQCSLFAVVDKSNYIYIQVSKRNKEKKINTMYHLSPLILPFHCDVALWQWQRSPLVDKPICTYILVSKKNKQKKERKTLAQTMQHVICSHGRVGEKQRTQEKKKMQ